jgi:hypothetical protein
MSCLVTTLMNNSAERLLADIQKLAPDITARAAEMEAGRRFPLDLDLLASLLPRETYEHLYGNGADVIAGSNQPVGTAEAADAGCRVNGTWPFASGCQNADWMFAICVMTEDGKPLLGPAREAGPPLARDFFLPAGKLLPGERNHHV